MNSKLLASLCYLSAAIVSAGIYYGLVKDRNISGAGKDSKKDKSESTGSSSGSSSQKLK